MLTGCPLVCVCARSSVILKVFTTLDLRKDTFKATLASSIHN